MQRLDRREPFIPEGAEGPLAFLIESGQNERLPGRLAAAIDRARSQPGLVLAQAPTPCAAIGLAASNR